MSKRDERSEFLRAVRERDERSEFLIEVRYASLKVTLTEGVLFP